MDVVNRKMGPFEWLLLVLLSVLWGGSFFFVGVAVKALPPLTIVVLRVGLAAIALNLIVRATGLRMPKAWPYWKAFFKSETLIFEMPNRYDFSSAQSGTHSESVCCSC